MRAVGSVGSVKQSVVTTILMALVLGTGCSKSKRPGSGDTSATANTSEPTGPVVQLRFQPSEQQLQTISELVRKVDEERWRFNNKETNTRSNAPLFTYIAATERKPALVGAALQAMYSSYSVHSKRKAFPDEDFVAVVKHYLHSKDLRLVARALWAARTGASGKKGNPELIGEVVGLAKQLNTGAGRYAVIDTLRVVSAENRTEELMHILLESLSSTDAYVVSYALQAIYRSTRSIKDVPALVQRALLLAKHEDPGVRGRALELLGSIGQENPEVVVAALQGLSDPSGYVRSEACDALARLRYEPAIHKIVPLFADQESNRYDLNGWKTLDGKDGRVHHDGSAWGYVFDAAMNAVKSLSAGKLQLARVSSKNVKPDLERNLKATQDWYQANKSKIPHEAPLKAK